MSFIKLRKVYIAIRRKMFLPVKYFFNEASRVNATKVRDIAEIAERLAMLKKSLILATKRENRADIQYLNGQISELEWVIYGDS